MLDFVSSEQDAEFVGCFRTIMLSENSAEVANAWTALEEMETSETKNSMYNCNRNYDKFLRAILTISPPFMQSFKNIQEMPHLLDWFSKFPFPHNASHPISDDIAQFLIKSAKSFKVRDFFIIND